jgi:hypothetical protein
LGGLERPMASEQLDIPQGGTGFVDEPRRPGDERPPSNAMSSRADQCRGMRG